MLFLCTLVPHKQSPTITDESFVTACRYGSVNVTRSLSLDPGGRGEDGRARDPRSGSESSDR